jgi:cellulose synthase/poly-beta-1,6-N-acetylglucosamine synthase-like glycosyltransferase
MNIIPIFILLLIVFSNRYLVGRLCKVLRGRSFDPAQDGVQPAVTVVIPMYNEGRSIHDTVLSLLAQTYPPDKLSVTVVDDCSTDDSLQWASRAAAHHPQRAKVMRSPHNMGKRMCIAHAVRHSPTELIVSVDSDVIVDPDAIRQLVRRFTSERIAAVGGRVLVVNPHDNWLTRMQTIKYHFGYVHLKNLERAFSSVMCLSGCLTAYRRSVLLELEPILARRNLLGVPIKYGEDRFLTRQIIKAGYQTTMTFDARCWTKVPSTLGGYFSQQLRWRRSNIVDVMLGLSHAWRLHPLVAIHYLSLGAMLFSYPLIVVQNLLLGTFWQLALFHLVVLGGFGFVYSLESRGLPASQRVHPLWFLTLGALMPVTYLLHTVLAAFTLDSGSWETRGHNASEPAPPLLESSAPSLEPTGAPEQGDASEAHHARA